MINKYPIEKNLDYTYNVFVFEQINNASTRIKRKWMTYERILDELYKIGEIKLVDEIKYRITDDENAKKVFKTLTNKIKNKNDKLNLLINSI
jgi:hypothetical protein